MGAMLKQGAKAEITFDPAWKPIFEQAIVEVFEMMAGTRLDLNPENAEEPRGEQTAMVGLAGSLRGMVTLRCSHGAAAQFASLMLGGSAGSTPSMIRDALGELTNMIAGNFKAKISNLADSCVLSVPTVISGDDYSMSMLEPNEGITTPLLFGTEPIWVTLVTHQS
jgi:chemotaxis protein CheX